jgi:ligand-binding sensor domain-containing protein
MVVDQDGSLWWITGGASSDDLTRTLHHRLTSIATDQKSPTARIENMTIDQDLTGMRVNAIAPDPEHGVWLGTDRGLLYSDGETIREISLAPDQPTLRPHPRNLAIDTQGTAWIVTAQGVQQLPAHGSRWQDVTDFGLGPGINEWPLGTIAAAREGGIWATHGGDLWRFGGSTTTPLTGTVPLEDYCRLIHLTVDRAGNVWSPLGVCGVAVFKPQTGQWVLYASNRYNDPRDYSGTVWNLFIDGAGVVYARGDSNRLSRFVPIIILSGTLSQTWQPVAQPDGQLVLGADAQNRQWTVDCRTGEVWREQTENVSAPNGGSTKFVTAFGTVFAESTSSRLCAAAYRWHFDSRSWLWVYDGVNLFRYDGQAWRPAHQPRVGTVQDMTSGPDGRVWIVGDRGVAVYDPKGKQP